MAVILNFTQNVMYKTCTYFTQNYVGLVVDTKICFYSVEYDIKGVVNC